MPQITPFAETLTPEQNKMLHDISYFRIPINDKIALVVNIDGKMKHKAQAHIRQLVTHRMIETPQNINRRNERAVILAKYMQSQKKNAASGKLPRHMKATEKTYEQLLDEAIDILVSESQLFLSVAQDEGLLATIIAEGTLEVTDENGIIHEIPRGFFRKEKVLGYDIIKPYEGIDYIELPEDYYDRTSINAERAENGLPPLPPHAPMLATEQMLAQIDAVKQANEEFNEVVSNLFTNYTDFIVNQVLGLSETEVEDVETDEDSFHTGELGDDMDTIIQPKNKKVGRK